MITAAIWFAWASFCFGLEWCAAIADAAGLPISGGPLACLLIAIAMSFVAAVLATIGVNADD